MNDAWLPRELGEQLAVTTDGDGRAVAHDLDPTTINLVRVESDEYGIQWANLSATASDGSRRIRLAPVASVHGRLIAEDARAISGITIRFASWVAAGDDAAGVGLVEAVTDADGRFDVSAIVAGALSAAVEPKVELPFLSQRITDRPIEEGIASELVIHLERAVRVEGVVRDRDSGKPLAGAAVWLDRFDPPANDPRTDERGRYIGFFLPGQVAPSFRRIPRGYYFPQRTLETQPVPEGVEKIELKPLLLAPGERMHGHVVDRDGHGVAEAEVEAHWDLASGGKNVLHAHSDRDGAFTLDGVEPNAQLTLSAYSARGATVAAIVISADQRKSVKLVVDPSNAIALAGRVLDGERHPVASAFVRIKWRRIDSDGSSADEGYVTLGGRQRMLIDGDGRFRTPAMLVKGWEYRAEVASPGMLAAVTEFIDPVAWNTQTFGDIGLPASPRLRAVEGRVVDRRGRPLGGIWRHAILCRKKSVHGKPSS